MLVDGRAIAGEILKDVRNDVRALSVPPRITIITCTPDLPTQKYLALKKRQANEVGMSVNVIELLPDSQTTDIVDTITVATQQSDGIIVQLPLPTGIDTDAVLAAIPLSHDIDAIHYDETDTVLPPVVGAVAAIADHYQVTWEGQVVTVIGAGRLVGAPAALWAAAQGATVTTITRETDSATATEALQSANIIISGAGVPGLITSDRIRDDVAVFDAGTSEAGGTLVGDVDPACQAKASLLTPVPGGIGPVTVACFLCNVIRLRKR